MRFAPRSFALALSASTEDAQLPDTLRALYHVQVHLGPSGTLRALGQPGLADDAREALLRAFAEGVKLPDPVIGLLRTLATLGALRALPRVTAAFDRLAAARGVHRLSVTTAATLTPDDVERIKPALRKAAADLVGGTVVISWFVQPSLLGGVQLTLDDATLDHSFVTRLDQLQALASTSPTPA